MRELCSKAAAIVQKAIALICTPFLLMRMSLNVNNAPDHSDPPLPGERGRADFITLITLSSSSSPIHSCGPRTAGNRAPHRLSLGRSMNTNQQPATPVEVSPTQPTTSLPALPDNASPEEKDLYWLQHIYQGDRQRQLTLRAVLTGGILGMFMSISNLYTTLKIGWSFAVSVTACVLSYVTWNALRAATGKRL